MNASENKALSVKIRVGHLTVLFILAVVATMVFLVASFCLDAGAIDNKSAAVLLTFLINGILGTTCLCKSIAERPFSMVQMHWVFFVTMFVIAPLSQYFYGYGPWGFTCTANDYLMTNFALMIWGVLFALFSIGRAGYAVYDQKIFFDSLPKISGSVAFRALIISVFAALAVVALVGFSNLFSRDTFSIALDQTTNLLFDKAVRPLPVFAFVLLLVRVKQKKSIDATFILSLVLMLLACFPAGMARYNMACIYGAILILSSSSLFEKKGLFPALFLFAFLIIFPASNCFRHNEFSFALLGDSIYNVFANLPRGFCTGDYDAYSIVARTLKLVNSHDSTLGSQLIGALLFFVPRSVWPSKPVGSGNYVCSAQGQTFLNVSSPLPAEGIINFGFTGLIVFSIVAALISRSFDYWFIKSRSPLRLFYPFMCMLVFFIMRGDLLSSFAYSVGYTVSFITFSLICLGPKAIFRSLGSPANNNLLDNRPNHNLV